jgi:hypothetical protein
MPTGKKNETTKEDFCLFTDEFTRWQVKFELSHWRIDFLHTKINARARIKPNVHTHTATVFFDTDWEDDEITDYKIKESAKHEAIHLLTCKLYNYGCDRNFTGNDIDRAEEELVRKLEEIIN